jgi:CBS domain-containing protein/sporulation protein YlmC with PRC-barrel domain
MVFKLRTSVKKPNSRQLKNYKGALISLAGIIKQPVVNQNGQPIGQLVDLVFRWDTHENYPPLTGLVVKVAGRNVWIGAGNVSRFKSQKIQLNSAKLDLRDFKPRPGEVRLAEEVLDHQLIDVDGARVVRASDLYISTMGNKIRLVGLDVGYMTLLRRLGPRSIRIKPKLDVVVDWAAIQSFGGQGTKHDLKLSAKRKEIISMRPGELADLLEDLGREERRELLNSLTPEQAADALEEMQPEELETILRESTPSEIGQYLSKMEPDEAADALRDVDPLLREDLLRHMSENSAAQTAEVLSYDETSAGGFMNTALIKGFVDEKVESACKRLELVSSDIGSADAMVIVDKDGKFVYDLMLIDLLLADKDLKLHKLIKERSNVTASSKATIKEVAQLLVDSRRSSLVVLNGEDRPIGRILADDIVDALLPDYGRFHFPRLWS